MSRKVAFIAHCLLNQNAKVEGGAKRPGMWEPVIDLLRERGYTIRQVRAASGASANSSTPSSTASIAGGSPLSSPP